VLILEGTAVADDEVITEDSTTVEETMETEEVVSSEVPILGDVAVADDELVAEDCGTIEVPMGTEEVVPSEVLIFETTALTEDAIIAEDPSADVEDDANTSFGVEQVQPDSAEDAWSDWDFLAKTTLLDPFAVFLLFVTEIENSLHRNFEPSMPCNSQSFVSYWDLHTNSS
jgi:hypothetical protein